MSNKGDDCYFYYYSTCTKGDDCPFRHCEAAMGSETVCSLWQENRCFRNVCKFRHMEIDKKRKEIPCYWENQPGGCQKPHCAFHHEKPRMIAGLYVPPDKGTGVRKEKEEESPHDDHVVSSPPPPLLPPPPAISSSAQRRGLLKTETQESVPSPTHPPVVINSLDDEDDEDDQVSEEGGEASGVSPRKLMSSSKDDALNFGVQTLEEIRLRKALKASLKAAESPWLLNFDKVTSQSNKGAGTEKENIRSLKRPSLAINKNESAPVENLGKRKLTDRLGKRKNREEFSVESDPQLKESLAKRLGGFIESPQINSDLLPQNDVKPVRERLGKNDEVAASKSPDSELKPSAEIRIKTLEEIRQEKAAKSQIPRKGSKVVTEVNTATVLTKRGIKNISGPHVKTFSEIQHEKRRLQEKKSVAVEGSSSPERSEAAAEVKVVKAANAAGEVKVKTLAEIRQEKAARTQTLKQESTNPTAASDAEPKKRVLRLNKTASNTSSLKPPQETEKKVDHAPESAGKGDSSSPAITVKSFEEIMREKKLRKQQEEQLVSSNHQQPDVKKPNTDISKDKPPAVVKAQINAPAAAVSESPEQAKPSVRQRLGLKTQTGSSPVPAVLKSPNQQQKKEISPTSSPHEQKPAPPAVQHDVTAEVLTTPDSNTTDPPEKTPAVPESPPSKTVEMKVRPKLNVKPSVMKPAAQVRPGQKRKAAGSHCSAIAAVKPLTTVATEDELPSAKVKRSIPASTLDVGSGTQQLLLSGTTTTPVTEPLSLPKSPVMKAQARTRRCSVASGRDAAPSTNASAVDDFEDLLDEFADDRLADEIELDAGKGEDDLLLELSEMIDG